MRTCHSLLGRFAKEDHHEGPGNQSESHQKSSKKGRDQWVIGTSKMSRIIMNIKYNIFIYKMLGIQDGGWSLLCPWESSKFQACLLPTSPQLIQGEVRR